MFSLRPCLCVNGVLYTLNLSRMSTVSYDNKMVVNIMSSGLIQRFCLPVMQLIQLSFWFLTTKSIIHFVAKLLRNPAGIYLLKVNNRNTRTRCEICSKLTIKTPERRHWRRSGVFIVTFEHISRLFLVFLLLTLSR